MACFSLNCKTYFHRELQQGDSNHRKEKIKVNMWKKAQEQLAKVKQEEEEDEEKSSEIFEL